MHACHATKRANEVLWLSKEGEAAAAAALLTAPNPRQDGATVEGKGRGRETRKLCAKSADLFCAQYLFTSQLGIKTYMSLFIAPFVIFFDRQSLHENRLRSLFSHPFFNI